jgi:hypothetical protein
MARTKTPERLQTLEQKAEAIQRQIRALKASEKKESRQQDARRKIIAGALALEHFEKNPDTDFARIMFRLLDEYTRPIERHLFAFLPVREEAAHPSAPAETAAY